MENIINSPGNAVLMVVRRYVPGGGAAGGGGVFHGDAAAHIGEHVRVVVPVTEGSHLGGGETQQLRHKADAAVLSGLPVGNFDQLRNGGGDVDIRNGPAQQVLRPGFQLRVRSRLSRWLQWARMKPRISASGCRVVWM